MLRMRCKKNRPVHVAVLLLLALAITHCGGGASTSSSISSTAANADVASDSGALLLVVKQLAASTDPLLQVATYRVHIDGPGMEPVEQEFAGDTHNAVIENVAVGADRHVEVTALNSATQAVRIGDQSAVTVSAGDVTNVTLTLDTIPIFVNLHDGDVVPNTRLRPEIVAAPATHVKIQSEQSGQSTPLVDASLNVEAPLTDATTGHLQLQPRLLAPGAYDLRVADANSGRASQVHVTVIDGAHARGANFVSGGAQRATAGVSNVGGAWAVDAIHAFVAVQRRGL